MFTGGNDGGGLSPRMRGNLRMVDDNVLVIRSIPAHAGEPAPIMPAPAMATVYPRACGGTAKLDNVSSRGRGLSPRMRGNLKFKWARLPSERSIPAHAGEPPSGTWSNIIPRVYPRACGGTHQFPVKVKSRRGLSPRMRGNQVICIPMALFLRSIPAHAGEPLRVIDGAVLGRVYPRACGGTFLFNLSARLERGLSPPCGGTGSNGLCRRDRDGLSPRMRGNRFPRTGTDAPGGSIPAHAGEPYIPGQSQLEDQVYPRACGGTVNSETRRISTQGLSPRMRGNQWYRV